MRSDLFREIRLSFGDVPASALRIPMQLFTPSVLETEVFLLVSKSDKSGVFGSSIFLCISHQNEEHAGDLRDPAEHACYVRCCLLYHQHKDTNLCAYVVLNLRALQPTRTPDQHKRQRHIFAC